MNLNVGSSIRNNLLDDVFASIQDGVSILDRDLNILRVNGVMEDWYAHSKPLVGRKCYQVYQHSDVPCDNCPSIRCMQSGKTEFELVIGPPGSGVEWIELYSFPITDRKTGEITGVVEFVRDISQRVHAEMALAESDEKYRSIFDSVDCAIFINDRDTAEFIDANQIACDLLGRTKEDLLLMSLEDMSEFVPGLSPENIFEINSLAASGIPSRFESELHLPDSDKRWIEVNVRWIRISGEPQIMVIARDKTELKLAEDAKKNLQKQVQHSQKLESLGILAGGIAHDFNNILVGILGNADLALMDLSPEDPAWEALNEIEISSRRASELIRQMLAYSGRSSFQIDQIDLDTLISGMKQMLDIAISKKAELVYDLSEDIPLIEGDPTQLRQVLMNLVINASESLDGESGRITVKTFWKHCSNEFLSRTYLNDDLEGGEYCCLEVIDNGRGIESEVLPRLFDPFFTTKVTGRGLGLAAVLGIVRSHKGAISVESELDKGTTIRIYLPTAGSIQEQSVVSINSDVDLEAWSASGTILLVDDEESVVKVGRMMLEHQGFNVLTASDGEEAVRMYEKVQDDVACVVLDLTMPRMDGVETMNVLRNINESVKVVLCSGFSEQEISDRTSRSGFASVVQKPYTSSELLSAVYRAIENSKDPCN